MRISRRRFLEDASGAAAFAFLPGRLRFQTEAPDWAGFRMGLQTYTLRAFDLDGVLSRMKQLGLKHAEFYPGPQMPLTTDEAKLAAYRKKISDAGISVPSYGVCPFTKDHEANGKFFSFGKAMGIEVLVADPDPGSFDSLESLTKDFGMKIAIHNHGPGHRYGRRTDVEKAIEKRTDAIGACVDTGHSIRSGEDPTQVIRAFGSRVHDVHLKDASGPDTFTVLGKGKLDLVAVFRALKAVGFRGCLALEYELNERDPMEDVRQCLAAVREAARKI